MRSICVIPLYACNPVFRFFKNHLCARLKSEIRWFGITTIVIHDCINLYLIILLIAGITLCWFYTDIFQCFRRRFGYFAPSVGLFGNNSGSVYQKTAWYRFHHNAPRPLYMSPVDKSKPYDTLHIGSFPSDTLLLPPAE